MIQWQPQYVSQTDISRAALVLGVDACGCKIVQLKATGTCWLFQGARLCLHNTYEPHTRILAKRMFYLSLEYELAVNFMSARWQFIAIHRCKLLYKTDHLVPGRVHACMSWPLALRPGRVPMHPRAQSEFAVLLFFNLDLFISVTDAYHARIASNIAKHCAGRLTRLNSHQGHLFIASLTRSLKRACVHACIGISACMPGGLCIC